MPDHLQPGSHLSPDQLSAFAENALPGHERLAALTHLSDCAGCRQAVFLIQQSDPSLTTAPALETPRRGWFTLPQLFIAAGAAFACALILALIVHQHYTGPSATPATTAQLPPPPELPSPTPAPTPAQTPPPKPTVSAPKPIPPAQLSTAAMHPLMPLPAKILVPELKPQPPAYPPRSSLIGGAMSGTSSNYAVETDLGKQSLAYDSPARSSASPTSASAASLGMSPAPPTTAQADASPANSNVNSIQSLPLAARAVTTNAALAAPSQPIKLPSNKPTASQLNSGVRTLALDSAGALFLSLDHGKHWTAVTTQWSGKAVRLSFAASPARLYQVQPQQSQAASTGMAQQSQQAPIPTAGFELTTSTGAVWLSTDGLIWHPK